jgi:hypothetical protein
MERGMRSLLCLLLIASVASLLLATPQASGKWVSTSGLFFDLSGVIQLAIAGVFERIMSKYQDAEIGPPSYIARRIIDDPDRPRAMWLRNTLFYDARTGFWLIVLGFVFQLAGVWMPSPTS